MVKKFKLLIIIFCLAISFSLISNTYSRYVASSEGNVEVSFAKWEILVNNVDITNGNSSSITFNPTIESNSNVADGKMAPSSTGYFDVQIDPSNVDVSFKYRIDLDIDSEDIPDLMITKYAILDSNYSVGDTLTYNTLTNGYIENTVNYNNNLEPFTVRVFFEWYEGNNESMNDAADSAIGSDADNQSFTINANIRFEQVV